MIHYFIHIAKNGGTSVRGMLPASEKIYQFMLHGRTLPDGNAKIPSSLDSEIDSHLTEVWMRQQTLGVVVGNMAFGLHEFLDRPVAYSCLLRDPIERCKSYWYDLWRNKGTSSLWQSIRASDFDLCVFANRPESAPFRNDQVRLIAGSANQEIDAEHYEQAQHNLAKHFEFVGLTRTLDTSVIGLASILGLEATGRFQRRNIGNYAATPPLPRSGFGVLEDLNQWDRRLFEWAESRYGSIHSSS